MTFEKLKGHGRTADDPLTMEPRYKTIFDVLGLGFLNLFIGKIEAAEEPCGRWGSQHGSGLQLDSLMQQR